MKWAALLLLLSTSVFGYDVKYSCDYPTTRENGDALARGEISEVLVYVEDSNGDSFVVRDTDDTCGGEIAGLPDGQATFYASTVDSSGLVSTGSDSITIDNGVDPVNRILGAPGLSFTIVSTTEPPPVDPIPPINTGGEVMAIESTAPESFLVVTDNGGVGGALYDWTQSITIPEGADVLTVRVGGILGGPTAVRFNGEAMTSAVYTTDADVGFTQIYYLINPDVGTFDLVLDGNTGSASHWRAITNTQSGVDKANLIADTGVFSNSWFGSATVTLATSPDVLAMDIVSVYVARTPTNGIDQEAETPVEVASTYHSVRTSKIIAVGASTVLDWTVDGSWRISQAAVAYNPATGGGGGTAYTLPADTGTFVQTGIIAGLLAARNIVAAPASFVEAGIDADLLTARGLPVDAGSFEQTGNSAGLLFDRTISTDSAAFNLTSSNAGLIYNLDYILSAENGNFAVTGSDAGLSYLVGYSLGAESADFGITGTDAGFSAERFISAQTDSYDLTGTDSAFNILTGYFIAAGNGAFSNTFSDSGVSATRTMPASVSSYSLSGADIGFAKGYSIALDSSAFSSSLLDAGLTLDRYLSALSTQVSLNLNGAIISYSEAADFADIDGIITMLSITPSISISSDTNTRTIQ